MRRERQHGHWLEVEREHGPAIEEMRGILRSGREVSNRDFEMRHRTRIDDYRGRKDSALALHYLWRVGEAMVTRRDRFERVYALTEAVAPAWALRDIDPAEADDRLMLKTIAGDGLGQGLIGINSMLRRPQTAAESAAWRSRLLADGSLVEVRVEGWRRPQLAIGSDAGVIRELERGIVPAAWAPIEPTTTEEATFLSPLDPVSARGRAKPLFGFDYVWEVYKPARAAHVRLLHDADPVGRPAGRAVRSEAGPDERHADDPRAVVGGRGARQGRGVRAMRWRPGCGGS